MARTLPLLVTLFCALPCQAAQWCSTDASTLRFETTFEGETLPGEFTSFTVRFAFDPARPRDGRLEVDVKLAAADMGDPEMNAVLFDPVWLDVDRYSQATYLSHEIDGPDDGRFVASGRLELKGNEHPVELRFRWDQSGDAASMAGEARLTRTDFDIGTGEWATGDSIGLEVRLDFDVQLETCD